MPRGTEKKAKVSAVKWAARKNPKANFLHGHGKRSSKPTSIQDERPSQRIEPKRGVIAPEWARLQKNDHAKIPGTRIQCLAGGIAVRVVLEDGKKFPPHKALMAKRHLKRLAEKKLEKDEIARMIAGSTEHGGRPAPLAPAEPVEDAPSIYAQKSSASSSNDAAPGHGSKKACAKAQKEAAWKERQEKLAQQHAGMLQESGRELVSQEWCDGEVVQKVQGRAWVRMSKVAQLPDGVLARLRTTGAEMKSQLRVTDGELLPICFGDLADRSLDLKPGVALQFKLYTDKHGVGGCEAKAAPKIEEVAPSPSKKRSATEAAGSPQSETSKKRKTTPVKESPKAEKEGHAEAKLDVAASEADAKMEQAEGAAVQASAKVESDRVAAEAEAKADQARLAAQTSAKAECDRLAAEAQAKAEQDRLAAEASAKAERDRLAAEAAVKTEQDRVAAEASAKTQAKTAASVAKATQVLPQDLESLTVEKLKEKCREADLKVSGSKAELVARIYLASKD